MMGSDLFNMKQKMMIFDKIFISQLFLTFISICIFLLFPLPYSFLFHNFIVFNILMYFISNYIKVDIQMGYEEIVPPIPGREQEIHALNNLQKSWLNQPYYKYYMNESLRTPKIAFSENLNSVYRHLAFNFIVSVVALAPVALFARRFFITRSGIPLTYVYNIYNIDLMHLVKFELITRLDN